MNKVGQLTNAIINKAVEKADLGNGILAVEKAERFIQVLEDETVIWKGGRVIRMNTDQEDISRITYDNVSVTSGLDASGNQKDLTGVDTEPGFGTNRLTTKPYNAVIQVTDQSLKKNIEREMLGQTVVDGLAMKTGNEIEQIAIFADTDIPFATNNALSQTDGFVKLAGNKLYGVESVPAAGDEDFDPADVEDMFTKMLLAVPKTYKKAKKKMVFYVDDTTWNDYLDVLIARQTILGDTALTQDNPLFYKGHAVIYVPALDDYIAEGTNSWETGRVCLLGRPENYVYGIFEEIAVEDERHARERLTYFISNVEVDFNYEDENAIVAAYIEKEKE